MLVALFLNILTLYSQPKAIDCDNSIVFKATVNYWFSAWDLIYRDVYKLNKIKAVEFVFFDNEYVYSTSNVTINDGTAVEGPSLLNLNLNWRKDVHDGYILLPDKTKMPIGIMAFASLLPNENDRSFIVMPLPSFWKGSDVNSNTLGLSNLLTGIFIHEFSHTQLMQSFGEQLSLLEKSMNVNMPFDDNLIQHIFQKDSDYVKVYNQEVDILFYIIKQEVFNKELFNRSRVLMNQRHKTYFKAHYRELQKVEDFFITMEGFGQYSMYLWLIHPKGGNYNRQVAIEGVIKNKKWWSQEEGFAMFLVMDKVSKSKKWTKKMFSQKSATITSILERRIS